MNHPTDRERLLAEVLAEAEPTGFRETMLGETLRLAGRRRQVRSFRQATIILAGLGLFLGMVWRLSEQRRAVSIIPIASYVSVHTEPLPVSAIISTHPFAAPDSIISPPAVELVRTTPVSGKYRNIDDDDLLELVGQRLAILVRTGPHAEKLVFVNPSDQKDFPLN